MASGGKTTLCDYSVLFSSVIYREKTARLDFG
nr:MAG TPA_asm: Elongation factor Tu-B state, conserved switch I.6A [Caudoviricetes sp.]